MKMGIFYHFNFGTILKSGTRLLKIILLHSIYFYIRAEAEIYSLGNV